MLLDSFVNTEQQRVIGIFYFWWVWCPGGALVEDELNVAFQGALSEIEYAVCLIKTQAVFWGQQISAKRSN